MKLDIGNRFMDWKKSKGISKDYELSFGEKSVSSPDPYLTDFMREEGWRWEAEEF